MTVGVVSDYAPTERDLELVARLGKDKEFTMSQENAEMPSSGLRLEEGKFYRNRLGEIVEVRLAYPGHEFCFEQVNDLPFRYRADGRYADNETDPIAALDLVEEITPMPWPEIHSKLRAGPKP